jgi:hypothetical protein
MKLSDVKTNADCLVVLRQVVETQLTALNGVIDKFPENVRKDLQGLKDSLNGYLTKLQPLDQVPAAQEAAWAYNCLVNTISHSQEIINQLLTKLGDMGKGYATNETALNEFKEKIAKKELVDKDAVGVAVSQARKEGEDSLRPQIVAMRKSQIALAKLPDAPDDVLALNADDFTKRFDGAIANVRTAGEKKITSEPWLKKTAWLDTPAFNGEMEIIADLVKPAAKAKDPLLGNGNPPKKEGEQSQTSTTQRRVTIG